MLSPILRSFARAVTSPRQARRHFGDATRRNMTVCKLLFGVNHPGSGNITLTISGGPSGTTMPNILAEDSTSKVTAGVYNAGTQEWSITLTPEDYVVRLDLAANAWFNGQLPITASAAVNFVYYGSLTSNTTVAWNDTTALGRGDPKDPWPPPVTPYITMAPASYTWHDTQLQAASSALPKDLQLSFDEPREVATNL
jgi:hypothetical protein